MHAPEGSPSAAEARDRMQRVRVGVTGLAAIILVVVLATAIATGVRRNASAEKSATAPIAENIKIDAGNMVDPRAEPLAQLGVAPGGSERKEVTVPSAKRPN